MRRIGIVMIEKSKWKLVEIFKYLLLRIKLKRILYFGGIVEKNITISVLKDIGVVIMLCFF